ncbi:hypothetical protein BGZ76_008905 [Entomortierella beljakovae]|nr:hypothetical protein BGZ76_008905 [Entomortierella beljakovae]
MEKQQQLYDINTVAIWTPFDHADTSLSSASNIQGSSHLQQHLATLDQDTKRKLAQWKLWFLKRVVTNISPLFLTTTVPSGLASALTPLKSSWQISQSPDSQFLAVNHDDKIEFRTQYSNYQIVHAVWSGSRKQELYPKWRKIAWSLDSKLVARSFSDGMVEIIDVKGRLIATILPKDQQEGTPSESDQSNNASSQLFVEPLSFLGFVNARKNKQSVGYGFSFNGNEYAYELITITYDGTLRSYLFNTPDILDQVESSVASPTDNFQKRKSLNRRSMSARSILTSGQNLWLREGSSEPGFFCFYHKFSFRDWFRTVACASIDEKTGVICIGGALQQSKDQSSGDTNTPSNLDSDSITHSKQYTGYSAIGQTIQKLLERDSKLTQKSVHTVITHEKYGALSLDCSGSLTSWNLSKEHGGEAKMTWDSDHLNYFARSKEHRDLSFQEFQKLVKEYQSNGTSSQLVGVVNGRCVSMRYWTKDAILLGYESGAMIVLQIPDLINILGQEPKVFASCLEFTNSGFSSHDEQVFVIEEITAMIRARVVGDRWIMLTDMEDKALGEPTEEEIAQMMGNERLMFKWIAQLTRYFSAESHQENQARQQRLILVPKRTLSLHRMLRVPPEELMYRKLESRDYSSALAIASTYELNTDIIYQYQWKKLNVFSADVISELLDKIKDKQWVLANCIDCAKEDQDSIRTILEYGLQLTEGVMEEIIGRCGLSTEVKIEWIGAAASGRPMAPDASRELISAQLTEKEILWCKYRWYIIKYLNRLSTFAELIVAENESRAKLEAKATQLRSQKPPTHDPLDFSGMYDERQAPPLPLLTGTFNVFKDIDLSGQARIYAEAEFIEGVRILFTRHNYETWPWRLAILDRIPESCPVDLYRELLPQIDPKTNSEKQWTLDRPWRETDWVDVCEFRTTIFGTANHEMDIYLEQQALTLEERKAAHGGSEAANLDMVTIKKESEEILPSIQSFPAPNEVLSHWYIDRALAIDRGTGQILEERRLVQYGVRNYIPYLETISEDLEILYKLVYEIKPGNRNPDARAIWADTVLDLTLEQFSLMNPMEVVQLCLGMSDEFTIVQDIRRLVMPYLTVVISRRWQRNDPIHVPGNGLPAGQDPHNPMSYLYAYLLSQSPTHLSWVGAVIQASKPVFELEERIISDDMDLSWLTMSCMYGCRTVTDWKVMSDMIVSLPLFEQTEDVDELVDKVRRAELRKDIFILGANNTSTTTFAAQDRPRIPQQLDPLNMYPAFVKYAPTQGLMQHALDTLEKHLTAAELLARYDLPVQLSWFLENSDSEANQLSMVTKMARLASGGPERMGERFDSDDEWMLLLEDLIRLRGNEQNGGVLGLVSEQDIYKEYLAGVLSCGKFELAKATLFPPGLLPPVRLAIAEKLVIDCSNEMYNNATSGNRHQGLMKMAYECLKVLPETANIRREMDLIEATNFMTSTYNLTAPGSNVTILPFQIRSTDNRLSLVRRLIMTQDQAYHDHEAMLELAIKVTGIGQKKVLRQQVEVQLVGMLIEKALKEKNYIFALHQSERLMELLKISGSVDMNQDGSPKVRRITKSSSSLNSTANNEDGRASPSPLQSKPASRPESRTGVSHNSYSSQRIIPSLLQLSESDPSAKNPWEIFVQVGTESAGREYSKRMAVVGYALACCPFDKTESVLELWRSLEMESVHAPVAEVDPRRGVVGFMSNMIDRTGSNASQASGLGYGSGYNPGNATVSGAGATGGGPLSEIIGRVGTPNPKMTGMGSQDTTKGANSTHEHEGGRRRDKLKSLVSSIWAQ